MTYGAHAVILSVDGAGHPRTVVNVTGDTGDISGFLLDADDHLDILYNSVAGEIVTSYTRDGSKVFSSAFACNAGILGPLAAGSSFVVMQSGPCGMDLTGAHQFSPPPDTSADSVTIDAANNLYAAGGTTLASYDGAGSPRWSVPTVNFLGSAPLLGTSGLIYIAEIEAAHDGSPEGTVSIAAYSAATGGYAVRYPTTLIPSGSSIPARHALVTAARQVVFGIDGTAMAIAVDHLPDPSAEWPTGAGGPDRRNAALGH